MGYHVVRSKVAKGQAVWMEARPNEQRNGTIISVLYDDDEVLVKFLNTEYPESLTFDELEGNWTDALGGMWMINS